MEVPNACTTCHTDRSAAWAAGHAATWWHRDKPARMHSFAEAFHAADSHKPGAEDALSRIARDPSQAAIVRGSALARLADRPGRAALEAARTHLNDPDPLVRRAALMVLEAFPPADRLVATPLLRDPMRAVRIQAAWVLAEASQSVSRVDKSDDPFARAAEEFIQARRYNADRPEERTTLGFFFAQLGRSADAIAEYRAALRLATRYIPAYVNLSDLYREQGLEKEAEQTIRDGLAVAPDQAVLHHALGLSAVRTGRSSEAIQNLKRATELAPHTARFAYTYAVALHSSGRVNEALLALRNARAQNPQDRDLLLALTTFHRDAGEIGRALEYALLLQQYHPDDPDAAALVRSLQGSRAPSDR